MFSALFIGTDVKLTLRIYVCFHRKMFFLSYYIFVVFDWLEFPRSRIVLLSIYNLEL